MIKERLFWFICLLLDEKLSATVRSPESRSQRFAATGLTQRNPTDLAIIILRHYLAMLDSVSVDLSKQPRQLGMCSSLGSVKSCVLTQFAWNLTLTWGLQQRLRKNIIGTGERRELSRNAEGWTIFQFGDFSANEISLNWKMHRIISWKVATKFVFEQELCCNCPYQLIRRTSNQPLTGQFVEFFECFHEFAAKAVARPLGWAAKN